MRTTLRIAASQGIHFCSPPTLCLRDAPSLPRRPRPFKLEYYAVPRGKLYFNQTLFQPNGKPRMPK